MNLINERNNSTSINETTYLISPVTTDSNTPSNYIITKTINDIKWGKYQTYLFYLCGMGWMADNLWMQVLAVCLPSIQQEFKLSNTYSAIATISMMCGMLFGSLLWGFI
ncbi:hypothetical protein HK099_003302, partial [Clydaea vesicula]